MARRVGFGRRVLSSAREIIRPVPGSDGGLGLPARIGRLAGTGLLAGIGRPASARAGLPGRAVAGAVLVLLVLVALPGLVGAAGLAGASSRPPLDLASPLPSAPPAADPTLGPSPFDLITKGLLVAGLLYITLRVLRRIQAGPVGGQSRLSVLETRTLAPKASIHLVAIGERRLVVGLTPGGIVALAELDASELPDTAPGELAERGDLPGQGPSRPARASSDPLLTASRLPASLAGLVESLLGRPGGRQ